MRKLDASLPRSILSAPENARPHLCPCARNSALLRRQSSGSARTPASGRSNEAIIFSRSVFSPADDGRPKTCRPVGINRCSISSDCSYSANTFASRSSVHEVFLAATGFLCDFAQARSFTNPAHSEYLRAAASLHWIQILFAYRRRPHALASVQRDRELSQLRLDLHLPERAQVQTAAPSGTFERPSVNSNTTVSPNLFPTSSSNSIVVTSPNAERRAAAHAQRVEHAPRAQDTSRRRQIDIRRRAVKRNNRHAVAIQIRLSQQLENRALRARDAIRRHAARRVDRKNKQVPCLCFSNL